MKILLPEYERKYQSKSKYLQNSVWLQQSFDEPSELKNRNKMCVNVYYMHKLPMHSHQNKTKIFKWKERERGGERAPGGERASERATQSDSQRERESPEEKVQKCAQKCAATSAYASATRNWPSWPESACCWRRREARGQPSGTGCSPVPTHPPSHRMADSAQFLGCNAVTQPLWWWRQGNAVKRYSIHLHRFETASYHLTFSNIPQNPVFLTKFCSKEIALCSASGPLNTAQLVNMTHSFKSMIWSLFCFAKLQQFIYIQNISLQNIF